MTDINSIYQKRVTQFATIAKDLKEKYNRFSIIRLIVFFAAAFIAIFIFTKFNALAGVVFLIIALIGFGKFVFWHRAILQQANHHQLSLIHI